jgi:hypothetical protein
MGDKRNRSNATGKWVLEKGQFTYVSARKDDVSANQNGRVGGKWEWKKWPWREVSE